MIILNAIFSQIGRKIKKKERDRVKEIKTQEQKFGNIADNSQSHQVQTYKLNPPSSIFMNV